MIAYEDLVERKVITPEGAKSSTLPFSNGILAGNTLYISGKGDHLPDGGHPETFEEQVRQAMRNVGSVLNAAGIGFENVVMSHVYLNNYDNYGIANKVYSEFFEYGNEPARATIFVDSIPGDSHVEITCIATTDLSTRKVVRPTAFKYGPEEMAPTASPAVWAGNILYMSVQSGWVPWEGITTTDLEIQMRRMMQHHTDILSAAGLGWSNVVSGNVYLRNINDYTQMNAMYRGYFLDGKAVRTTLQNNSGYEKNDIRVRTSFIAARTRK
jgi:reactive intermediate/imine deaminase